jgi:hypothetical protein
LIGQTKEWGGFSDRVRIPHDIETGDQFHVAWTTLRSHVDALGLVSTGTLRPILCQHSCAASSPPMQASSSRPPLIALFAAASQLELMFNFGGLAASADTTCDPNGITARTIVVAKAEVVSFT